MNGLTALLFVLSFLVVFSAASIPTDNGVYVLSEDNFDQFINDEQFTVIEFYAPWCGHCKKLAPEYAEAAQILAKEATPVKLAKVDCTQEKSVCDRFGVRGYPTIKNFIAGKDSEYQGPRVADGIVKYVLSKTGPASVLLADQEAIDKYRSDTAPTIIFYGSEDSELFSTFQEIAKNHREDLRFGHVHSQQVLDKSGHSNTVVIYQAKRIASKLENDSIVHTGDKNDLAKFITQKHLPLAGEFTDSNKRFYQDLGLPVVKVVFNIDWKRDPKTITYHLNRIRKIASEFIGKLSFAIASPQSQTGELRDLGIEGSDISFFIHDLESDHKYRPEDAKYSPDALRQFVNEFVAGKVEKYIKSEPVPDNSANDVKVVVGKNFEEIVYDNSKDVLLEAYAPWCGHCKKLVPIYEELAKKLSKNSETLTIAKIDATANTVPAEFKIQGFPSIFFVPANNKGAPVQFEGEREVDDFIEFIKKHASFPVVV